MGYIGYSLSFCVKDIVEGKIPLDEVNKLVTSTAIDSSEIMDQVMEQYKSIYWSDFPEEAERIARQLFAEGKIEQPKLVCKDYYRNLREHTHWERDGQPFPIG